MVGASVAKVAEDMVASWLWNELGAVVGGLPGTAVGSGARDLAELRPDPVVRDHAAQLIGRILICPPLKGAEGAVAPIKGEVFLACLRACSRRRCLAAVYEDGRGKITERRLEPQGFLVRSPFWYLLSFDLEHEGLRTLRIDRIDEVHPMLRPFSPLPAEELFGDERGVRLGMNAGGALELLVR